MITTSGAVRIALATTLAVAVAAGCTGDDGRSAEDLAAREVEVVELEADGAIVSVSRQGTVLAQSSGDVCTFALDGTELECFDVEVDLDPILGVSWSPGGTKVASSGSALSRSADGDVTVLDLETGEVDVLTEDDSEDMSADMDLGPAWLDDDTLVFTRIEAGDGPITGRPVRNVRLDLDADAEPRDVDADHSGVMFDAAVMGGDYLGSYSDAERMGIVRVAEDGEVTDVIAQERSSDRLYLDGSPDCSAAVVYGIDPTLQVPPTARFLTGDDEPVDTGIAALAATVDPGGDVVAALAIEAGEELTTDTQLSVRLWDPDADESIALGVQDVSPAFRMTWTDDDRLVAWRGDSWTVIELTDA